MNDRELAIRLAQHDDEALSLLVERHYAPIYRILRRLGGSDEQARESTQETLLEIRRSAGSFKGRSTFATWAYRIAYRTFVRSRRRRSHEGLSERIPLPDHEVATLDRIVFEQAIAKLTPKLRDAFVLHELNGLSMDEVAQVLSVPSNTVKSRVARARHALQSELEKESTPYVLFETR